VIEVPALELTETQQRALDRLPPRVAEALLHFRDNLLARFSNDIRRIILYGSFARGDWHDESDVDVLVVVGWEMPKMPNGRYLHPAGDPRRNEIVDIAYDVTLNHGPYVSPLVVDETLFRKGRDAVHEARREGIELYRHPGAVALAHVEAAARRALKEATSTYSVDPDDLEDIRMWLAMADEDLQAVHELYRTGHHRRVISGVYYAMFYATKAALLAAGVDVKSHEGAISEFGKLYVSTGRIDGRYGRILAERYKDRLDSDYKPRFPATQEIAEDAIQDARLFIAKARELVEDELSQRGAALT